RCGAATATVGAAYVASRNRALPPFHAEQKRGSVRLLRHPAPGRWPADGGPARAWGDYGRAPPRRSGGPRRSLVGNARVGTHLSECESATRRPGVSYASGRVAARAREPRLSL